MGIMKRKSRPEIVINSTRVTPSHKAEFYDFVLNDELKVVECGYVESLSRGVVTTIDDFPQQLEGLLFELNHVRVNPRLDNTAILARLAIALEQSGVYICNPPSMDLMAMCFKPLGELSEVVRFYVKPGADLVFLSHTVKLRRVK
jgi:hypothetical protein